MLKRFARPAAYLVLAAVTAYGVWQFATGDPGEVVAYWRGKLALAPLIVLLACLDVALEGIGWLWVYDRLGLRSRDRGGALAFLAGRAGLLLPAQLGRLIRPDSMARLGRGTMPDCLRAEAAAFVLDGTSVVALIAALATAMLGAPLAAPVAALAIVVAVLFLGNRAAKVLAGTPLALPVEFWWSWRTFAIVGVEMAGWAVHGAALYLVIRDLPGHATLADTIFFAAGSSVAGAGTGLPGGVGATEGLLGMSLTVMSIPAAHLALAIAAFRLVTFWIWIPVGWLALAAVRRRAVGPAAPALRAASPEEQVLEPVSG